MVRLHPFLILGLIQWSVSSAFAASPPRIIYETDMESDIDDAATLAVLHKLADQGQCGLALLLIALLFASPLSAQVEVAKVEFVGDVYRSGYGDNWQKIVLRLRGPEAQPATQGASANHGSE